MNKFISIFLLSTILISQTFSQVSFAKNVNIPADTEIWATLKQDYTSEKLKSGINISAPIDNDIIIDGTVIFKKGTNLEIVIDESKKKSFGGNGGYIAIKKAYATDINGQKHTFILNKKVKGKDKEWVPVCIMCGVTIILAPLMLFGFVKGQPAILPEGTIIDAKLEQGFVIKI